VEVESVAFGTKHTIAMHLANPTRIRPSLSSGSSGRNAHARPSLITIEISAPGVAKQERHSLFRTYHQEGSNDPVEHNAEPHLNPDLAGLEDAV
jgi:hypothetical protein